MDFHYGFLIRSSSILSRNEILAGNGDKANILCQAIVKSILAAFMETNWSYGTHSKRDGVSYYIIGVDKGVDADDFPVQLHIQDAISSFGKTYEEIIVAVSRETSIFRDNPDGSMTPGSTTDLVVGALIRARLTGVLRKSLPPQVDATRVEVKQSVPAG